MEKDIIRVSREELKRLEIIHKVIDKKLKQKEAARILSLTTRQVRRIVDKLEKRGDTAIAHRKRGRPSNRKFSERFREEVLELVKGKYHDFGPTFASEKLLENEGIKVSKETVRQWMIGEHIWIPRKSREIENTHQWRRRKDCSGEMVQTDGSQHDWLEGRGPQITLLGYIDDATNRAFAQFYPAETTEAAMRSFRMYIERYGIPLSIYFDRNSIYKTTRQPSLDERLKGEMPKTQFEKVLDILNVEPIHAYSPQAKGRIERLFGTFQDRLIKEMRLAHICNIPEANEFLRTYLPKYNSLFSIPPANLKDLHRSIPEGIDLDWVFALREERTVSNDLTISWKNRTLILPKHSISLRRRRVMVIENLKDQIRIWWGNRDLEFEEVTKDTLKQRRKEQQMLLASVERKSSTPYRPAAHHPWRHQPIGSARYR